MTLREAVDLDNSGTVRQGFPVSQTETPRVDPPYAADEATMLRAFLDYYRVTIRRQAEDLTAEQLTTTLPPSDLTIGGLLKHLACVEHWWFSMVLLGRPEGEPWASVDWDADRDWDFHSAKEDSPAELLELFDRFVVESDTIVGEALRGGSLDQLAVLSRHDGKHASLRWILVHLIEEYARHAGHADLIRQSIDGATDL